MRKKILLTLLFLIFINSGALWAKKNDAEVINNRVASFEKRYGIPLIYKELNIVTHQIKFRSILIIEYDLLNEYLILFEEEINKYPTWFFERREIRAVILVTHLFSNKIPAQGAYSAESRAMIFDISRFSHNKALIRHSIHHELFHMMAFQTPGYIQNDPKWSQLNSVNFEYGKKNNDQSGTNSVNPQAPSELGFVTDYAMTSVEEDKAEVFACLMQESHNRLIHRWAEKDEILSKKIQLMRNFVASDFPEILKN